VGLVFEGAVHSMQIFKWGNSLVVRRLPGVVEALGLKEGDMLEIQVAGRRQKERVVVFGSAHKLGKKPRRVRKGVQ
jgi:antitoxin MazE